MSMTKFAVQNCIGDQIGEIAVPFTGDLSADLEAAYALFEQQFEQHKCGQCEDYTPRLSEEPLDNADQYPAEEPVEDEEEP